MKTKIRFLFIGISFCAVLVGQSVTVNKVSVLSKSGSNSKAFYPVFSEQGDKLLFSNEGYQGLQMYQFSTKKTTVITGEPGAGYEPVFAENDSKIFYRTSYIQQGRKLEALNSFDLIKQQKTELLAPQRNMKQARNFQNEFVVSSDKKVLKKVFVKSAKQTPVYVCGEDLNIVLYRNGNRQVLQPMPSEAGSILWISLSPNAKMILFTAARKGTFICDLSGKVIASLGKLNAPVWYDDNFVVGMQDKDNGQVVTESKVMMLSVNGKLKKQISPSNVLAMYPAASAKVGKVAYNTTEGSIEVIELTVQK